MKIAITTTDGVSIMTLFFPMQLGQALAKWQAVNPGKFVSYREISDEDIPQDRTARDEWQDNGATIQTPDMN
jgi:hypothetical protein